MGGALGQHYRKICNEANRRTTVRGKRTGAGKPGDVETFMRQVFLSALFCVFSTTPPSSISAQHLLIVRYKELRNQLSNQCIASLTLFFT